MNFYSIPTLMVSFIILIPTLLIFFKNKTSPLNISYTLLGLSIFVWLIGDAFLISAPSREIAIFRTKIGYTGVIFIPTTAYHFFIELLNLKREKKFLFLAYIVSFIFLYLCYFTPYFTNEVNHYPWGYYPKANLLQATCNFVYIILFTRSLLALFFSTRRRKEMTQIQYLRNKYVLWASAIAVFGGINYIPIYGINLYPFGYLFMLGFLSIIGYAIFKYRLLDVSLVVTRAGIFVAVYTLILGSPLLVIYYLQNQLVILLGFDWWIVPFLCSVALATLGPFLYIYIEKRAEDKLLKEQKSYQNILKSASAGMLRIRNLNLLLKLIVYVVTKIVKIKHTAIYLLDKENQRFSLCASRTSQKGKVEYFNLTMESPLIQKLIVGRETIVAEEISMRSKDEPRNNLLAELVRQLSDLDASLAIPSFVEDKLIGILILGEKRSGKLYSQDDLAVFSVLANQAALAIENAQFYDEIKQTHEQLFQAEKMATIGTMADGLSHQINNRFHALSLIAGDSLDMLKTFDSSTCNEEARQIFSDLKNALERIEANVLQGGEVVKGLLKYSRPGDGGFEAIDFKDVMNGAIDMVQYKIKLKEIELVQNIPSEFPKLHGNLTQLQEVFFNMIDNAYDAIKERELFLKEEGYRGKIEISISQNNGSLEIVVNDNGMGIKDMDRKKLFTPFFTTKATARKGTGLGLYVIEKIIASHNGKIKIDSAYQKGTSFIITLPLSKN